MAQSIVSEAAQIREMSPEELENEWHRIKDRTDRLFLVPEKLQNRLSLINQNYSQLTGKTLN